MKLPEMLELLKEIYEQRMPFNRLLDLRITRLTSTDTEIRIDMREELVGNFIREILHGGVISSVLDVAGGLVASVELLKNLEGLEMEELGKRMAKIGTIDLRVDFLRPGKGIYFVATGTILRKGSKVAVVRTELCND
ncbi:MAG: thioesterase family protein, partial [Proteobacteria bacterium]|nr:thioesterase family protein [Pseudomonadota bacterium]